MVKFYDEIPDMECLAGDTLASFIIGVEADELTNCSMQMLIAAYDEPEHAVISQNGIASENGFVFTLTSNDTQNLTGVYRMHFRLIGADGLSRRKLSGMLHVIPVPQGG